jgi:hypothetical protein
MLIKLTYFEGCPSWKSALKNMHTALAELNIIAKIELVLVESDEDAAKKRFLGSPSFQMNGQDLWPEERPNYYLGCRVYMTGEGLRGVPTVSMLKEKLSELMAGIST